ncbi:oxygenase MpaB family protein [Spirillospora sp. CA-294931]|uniref:oxygenase MpaB family protein n=1 Tax=Spirillospora sp. CA-294931 TaxID=3240042 RepID=UPI003D8DA2B7
MSAEAIGRLPVPEEPGVATRPGSPELPFPVRNALNWFALGAAGANVIMQLSMLPVGRGVAESKVDSGRADLHPVKRLRTTLSYVVLAWHGSDEERAIMRRETNRSHRHVRSGPGDDVPYNAFDRDLQLWVAACLYQGTVDVLTLLHGPLGERALDDLYEHAARFGTTLQVTQDMWPADRAAFDEYWNRRLRDLRMDDVTRTYLRRLVDLESLHPLVRRPMAGFHRMITLGFLPERFREELGLPWTPRDQKRFDAHVRRARLLNRLLPAPLRAFPWNLYLWEARLRIRTGRPIV